MTRTRWARLRSWASATLRRSQMESEMDAEVRFHVQTYSEELIRGGVPPEEAQRRAALEFGGAEKIKEECRDARGANFFESLLQDLRYGLRTLRKAPTFATIAILTLGLGIGATTAMFSIVNAVLLRPLAYRQPDKLYVIREGIAEMAQFYPSLPANLNGFLRWQSQCRSFEQIAIVRPADKILTGAGESQEIHGGRGSANLFDVLGVQPQLGRSFLADEDRPGNDHVVILTDSFWRGRFHADPSLIGRSITLDGEPDVVVGILPPTFRFPKAAQLGSLTDFGLQLDFFKPLGLDPTKFSLLGEFDYAAIGRLKPGASPKQALAELNIIQAQIVKDAKENVDLHAELWPLETQVVGPARRGLLLLLGAVAAMLLIVCANLASLLLARIPNRLRESAIRSALGASRSRLVRQMLTESILLSVLGGLLGIGLAYLSLHQLVRWGPIDLPRLDEVRLDARVLGFAFLLSMVTGIVFGTLPAWRVTRTEPQDALKSGALTATESRRTRRLRESFIAFEVGASTLLLIVAGLLTTSLVRLLAVDKGFSAERTLTVDVTLPRQSYTSPAQQQNFYDSVLREVQRLPGVSHTGWISKLPFEGQEEVNGIQAVERPTDELHAPLANFRFVSPDYFQAAGIPLRQGRFTEESDTQRHVAVISQSVADKLWPGENPIGKQFHQGGDDRPITEVIGVVGDIRSVALDQLPLLLVYAQSGDVANDWSGWHASLVVRSTSDPVALASALRGAVRTVDSTVPIVHLRQMTEVVTESVGVRRFQMSLVVLFALLALSLAAIGIYGVLAYSVEQRRQELGLRRALGAQVSDLRWMILRQGMSPVAIGLLCGTAASLLAGSLIRSLLYGVTASDPLTIATVALVVLAIALLACYLPARRSMTVDPMVALRYE
ncbi:MAG: ABC transporter permease [Candidatus Acidiferrales bacterium]